MERELLVENISYKNRSIKVDGRWIPVAERFDLNLARKHEIQRFTLSQDIDGNYIIQAKI